MTFHGIPWNKGKHWSENIKKKISESMTGRKRPPFSEEWRRHMGDCKKGKHMSEEARRRQSLGHKGQIPWNKGKHTGLIPTTHFKIGNIPWNKGKKLKKKHGNQTTK